MSIEKVGRAILDSSFKVHTALGAGLLESAYEACMVYELRKMGLLVEQQKILPVVYEGEKLDAGYRLDLLVEKSVVVELKAVERVRDVHMAQLLSYLKLSGCELGYILNFNVVSMKQGIRRVVNSLSAQLTT
ncbi:MAG: GxxExxY protein [Proteobacteria bacterium]|nr:GxxExxY protein [Pseudomonadota bacterium]